MRKVFQNFLVIFHRSSRELPKRSPFWFVDVFKPGATLQCTMCTLCTVYTSEHTMHTHDRRGFKATRGSDYKMSFLVYSRQDDRVFKFPAVCPARMRAQLALKWWASGSSDEQVREVRGGLQILDAFRQRSGSKKFLPSTFVDYPPTGHGRAIRSL